MFGFLVFSFQHCRQTFEQKQEQVIIWTLPCKIFVMLVHRDDLIKGWTEVLFIVGPQEQMYSGYGIEEIKTDFELFIKPFSQNFQTVSEIKNGKMLFVPHIEM